MMATLPFLLLALVGAGAIAYRKIRKPRWLQTSADRELAVIDRVALTHQHSVHLLSVRGRWLAVAVTPSGCSVLDSGSETDTQKALGAAR